MLWFSELEIDKYILFAFNASKMPRTTNIVSLAAALSNAENLFYLSTAQFCWYFCSKWFLTDMFYTGIGS